ncbi:MAG: ADP-forming succinate--CoA ligase subunit beta [bacterium]|nr:ADP-forming succinate--CoA ligase subunit beta [bacterium]
MDLLEYQGKQYFARYGLPVSPGDVADTVEQAVQVAEQIGQFPVVLKAQVQIGGRGKQGGIQIANTLEEVRTHAAFILNLTIYDRTGTVGYPVRRIWIEKASDIKREYYASFTLDRSAKQYLGILSRKGGVDIEQVAEEEPEAIARLHINPLDGLTRETCADWVRRAELDAEAFDGAVDALMALYDVFTKGDCDLAEINPLILTPDNRVHALDAKVTLEDNAEYRHPEWEAFKGVIELDGRDKLAAEKGLQYIGLDGSVGIIANGAGLAMSTLDTVKQVGGEAANFLDIGGGASADTVTAALEVISTDPNVKAILINIFGGVTWGDKVANGIVEALGRVNLSAPLVIRIDGTRAAEGRAILEGHLSERVMMARTMVEAARTAVELAAKG